MIVTFGASVKPAPSKPYPKVCKLIDLIEPSVTVIENSDLLP